MPAGELWRDFARNRLAVLGAVAVVLFYGLALFAPSVAPQDYLATARKKSGKVAGVGQEDVLTSRAPF